jgi:hypothetical protein
MGSARAAIANKTMLLRIQKVLTGKSTAIYKRIPRKFEITGKHVGKTDSFVKIQI